MTFIKDDIKELDLDEVFAICSYVPPWYKLDMNVVKSTFKNLFIYYPSTKIEDFDIVKQLVKNRN